MSRPNEPAFPSERLRRDTPSGLFSDDGPMRGGLSKREYFACAAMQGMLAHPRVDPMPAKIAACALDYADALLAELSKEVRDAQS